MTSRFLLLFSCLLLIALCVLSGCGSSNGPTSSGLPDGGGYRINISAAAQVVPPGGTTILQVYVVDSGGVPVKDGEIVLFSSNIGATFDVGDSSLTAGQAKTLKGVAQVIYRAPTEATNPDVGNRSDLVSVSYLGAVSTVEIQMGL